MAQGKLEDFSGRKFGRLLLKKLIIINNKSHYLCLCECGNEKIIEWVPIRKGYTKSCGCLKNDILIDGTNVSLISSTKIFTNNTSGVRGVHFDKQKKRWRATINFKKKTYRLGDSIDIEQAIQLRKEAEEKVFGDFLNWYKNRR